jgi:shikimate kinase
MIGIVLVGLNGVGKSTLGKILAERLNIKLLEVEDYWFENKHDYENPRTAELVSKLMLNDIHQATRGFVITGNIMNLSAEILNQVTHIFYLKAPVDVRMKRIEEREIDYWGELKKDDAKYEQRQKFYEFARKRSSEPLEKWLEELNVPVVELDGCKTVRENIEVIRRAINE